MGSETVFLRWVITSSFFISSGMGIYFSIPLWQKKVPPNPTHGFRTSETLTNPELWYRVNEIAGRNLTILSLAILVLAVVFHFTLTRNSPIVAGLILTVLLVVGTIGIAVHGMYFIK